MYFFADDTSTPEIAAVNTHYSELDYVRFDGQRISRLDPDYYLGYQSHSVGIEHELQQRSAIAKGGSSTNNNNNNNGNNNG